MTKKEKREIMALAVERLEALYPDALCALEWNGEPWRLLVMGRLSAQCTDARVNIVCRELFAKYPTCSDLADAPLSDIEDIIRPCGLFRSKAESIKSSCTLLRDGYGGVLPDSMEELLKFPGVGRKIANLLLGDVYGKPAIVADTHCMRICGRLGMYREGRKDPLYTERVMSELVSDEKQSDFCHRIVQFGRDVCTARSPACDSCPLSDICAHAEKIGVKRKKTIDLT